MESNYSFKPGKNSGRTSIAYEESNQFSDIEPGLNPAEYNKAIKNALAGYILSFPTSSVLLNPSSLLPVTEYVKGVHPSGAVEFFVNGHNRLFHSNEELEEQAFGGLTVAQLAEILSSLELTDIMKIMGIKISEINIDPKYNIWPIESSSTVEVLAPAKIEVKGIIEKTGKEVIGKNTIRTTTFANTSAGKAGASYKAVIEKLESHYGSSFVTPDYVTLCKESMSIGGGSALLAMYKSLRYPLGNVIASINQATGINYPTTLIPIPELVEKIQSTTSERPYTLRHKRNYQIR